MTTICHIHAFQFVFFLKRQKWLTQHLHKSTSPPSYPVSVSVGDNSWAQQCLLKRFKRARPAHLTSALPAQWCHLWRFTAVAPYALLSSQLLAQTTSDLPWSGCSQSIWDSEFPFQTQLLCGCSMCFCFVTVKWFISEIWIKATRCSFVQLVLLNALFNLRFIFIGPRVRLISFTSCN